MADRVASPSRRSPRSGGFRPSLRLQLAFVIALLSLLPNLVMAGLVLLPTVRDVGGLEPRVTAGLVGWLALVVAFSAGIGAVLARVLLAPLTRVTRDADALPRTARRLGRARLATLGDDPPEIRSLRRAIDRLLEQVQTEQARRSAFTATLMHDMKTPLLAQRTALELVRDAGDGLGEEDRKRLLDEATAETAALGRLVQQLVDAHRFEQGEVRPKRVPSELRPLVEAQVARRRDAARARNVHVELDGDATVVADPDLIGRAVDNLVGNAVRYARSRVRIELRPGLLRISDDGPGLPAPLEQLARPFNDQPTPDAPDGADGADGGGRFRSGTGGLGLYVARGILEAHGGRLVSEASGPGGTVLLAYLGDGRSTAEGSP